MRTETGRNVGRALASLAGLVALVVGVPALLWALAGWPLPHGVPTWSQISRALSDGWAPEWGMVLRALASVVWVAWVIEMGYVVAELLTPRRGRRHPPRFTLARWGQMAAARLVGGLILVSTVVVPRPAFAAPTSLEAVVASGRASVVQDYAEPAQTIEAPRVAAVVEPASCAKHYVVVKGDTLWDIAERCLGDPLRFPEIVELSTGVVQPDGRALGNPHWIYPGWALVLPADAAVGVDTAPAPTAASDAALPSAPPAAAPTPAPASTPPSTAAATTTSVTTSPPTTVSAVDPPRRDVAAPDVAVEASPAATLPRAATDDPAATALASSNGAGHARRGGWSLGRDFPVKLDGVGLLGAGLLGAGVIATLDRMRRRQGRGGRVPLPDVELAGKELALRVGADPDGAAFVDVALRALATQLRESGQPVPDILGVELGPRTLTVLLDGPAPAPPGFSARTEGRRWVMSRSQDMAVLAAQAEGVPALCPALVSVGRTPGGVLMVDLEQAALTAAVGDEDISRETLAAAAVELATSEWADFLSLVLVGFGAELAALERVRVVDSVGDVIDELEQGATEVAALLEEAGLGSTLEARAKTEVPDAWVPTVVLCHRRPPTRLAKRLAAVAANSGNAGVGVLVAGAMEGAWELVAGEGQTLVSPLGLTVAANRLSPEESAGVGQLFDLALQDDPLGETNAGEGAEIDLVDLDDLDVEDADVDELGLEVDLEDGTYGPRQWAPPEPAIADVDDVGDEDLAPEQANGEVVGASAPFLSDLPPELADLDVLRDVEVLVGAMGPAQIWGATKPITRAKSQELLLYLAFHPRKPIDAERLLDVLSPSWRLTDAPPGRRHPAAVTLNTTTSVARGGLGVASDGRTRVRHLQGNGTRLYALDGVDLDYAIFCDQLERAQRAEGTGDLVAAAAAFWAGLSLVRGVPFEGVEREDDETKPYQWVYVEGIFYKVQQDIAKAAHRLAGLCLGAGDAEGATRAARRGLLASPGERLLTHDLLLAAGMARNPAALKAVLAEFGDLLEADEPYDRMDAETMRIYREQMAHAMRADDAAPTNGAHAGAATVKLLSV